MMIFVTNILGLLFYSWFLLPSTYFAMYSFSKGSHLYQMTFLKSDLKVLF